MLKNSDKYIQALRKHAQDIAAVKQEPAVYVPSVNPQSGLMLFNLIITALLVLLFVLNILLFALLKGSRTDKSSIAQRLDTIEATLKDNAEEVKQFSSKLGDLRKIIKEVSETNDGQSAAIENLTKAKNNIFNRVTELEAKSK